jgi:hypothetical protein
MSFLNDYLTYNDNNECPRSFHIWTAFVLLAGAVGRKCYLDHGHITVLCNLYVCLVGRQGLRKSTAKDIGRDLFTEALPNIPIGASVQSCQDIVKCLASEDYGRIYVDENNVQVECKPIMFFVNELKNFLSINPTAMIDFLTDIYDRKFYDAGTIKHGLQIILNPCVNVLACETPKWIISKLKLDIITGGFSRRMIYVYELNKRERIPFPTISTEARAARLRCLTHLQEVSKLVGRFTWAPAAKEYFENWYIQLKTPEDEIMEGYYESKHIQMLKVAMLLALSKPNPKLQITVDVLEEAIAHLDAIEENMPKLSVAAGRNELALPQQRILELVSARGGIFPEKQLLAETDKDATPMEQLSLLRHLEETERIVRKTLQWKEDKIPRRYVISFKRWNEMIANGEVKLPDSKKT